MNIAQVASEALRLDPKDGAILAGTIGKGLENPYVILPDVSERATIRLAKQRDDEIERGDVEPLSHQELMNRFRRNGG